jgi:hypothetical protein
VSFRESINRWPVEVVLAALPGVAKRTVFAWRAGDRAPEPWQQVLILDKLGEPPPAPPAPPPPAPLPGVPGVSPGRGRPRKAQPPADV